MSWPGISEYNKAFHDPSAGLLPEELKGGAVRRTPFGTPQPISGGFNLIYEYTLKGGKKKAVRCFIEEHPSAQKRLPLLLPEIETHRQRIPALATLFPETVWIDPCVKTAAGSVPAVIMDWVEGKTLGAWLDEHYDDPAAVREMREKVLRIITLLKDHEIAHGDLQGGNILVTPEGELKVIDYDGLRFFDETDVPAWEAGHPDFQHPERDRAIPPVYTDRFSAIVLDFGLAVTEILPELYKEHSTGENLVFLREDYLDPGSSPVLKTLKTHPRFRQAAEWFTRICTTTPLELPRLTEFREKAYEEAPVGKQLTPSPITKAAPAKPRKKEKREYHGPYPVYKATNYFGISEEEGHRIEVVGRITEVYRGTTKYGKPYAFISFDDWREDSFRVVIWSEGLKTLREKPGRTWEGRWISVMGLVDEPFIKHYRGEETTYYSITVHDNSQIHELTQEQAAYRLGEEAKRGIPEASEGENTRLLKAMREEKHFPQSMGPSGPGPKTHTDRLPSNPELLRQLKSGSSAASGHTASSSPATFASTKNPSPAAPTTSPSSPVKKKKKSNIGCWISIIIFGIIFMVILSRF